MPSLIGRYEQYSDLNSQPAVCIQFMSKYVRLYFQLYRGKHRILFYPAFYELVLHKIQVCTTRNMNILPRQDGKLLIKNIGCHVKFC